MTASRIAFTTSLIALLGCQSGSAPEPAPEAVAEEAPAIAGVQVAAPIQTDDPYELAGTLDLNAGEADGWDDLHNVRKLSDTIWSGGEPLSDAALERIAGWGVKTILSVDGKAPDAETASALGMRYVHVPIRYGGINTGNLTKIAKTFRELEAPFFVHCFHGVHRGPAAAMVGRLVLDGASREQVLAEMRLCGTSKKYMGLYQSIAAAPMPAAAKTAGWTWDFPAVQRVADLRRAMVDAQRSFDNLLLLQDRDFAADPAQPDLDARNEAEKITQYLQQCGTMKDADSRPADYRDWMASSIAAGQDLQGAFTGEVPDVDRARAAFKKLKVDCKACHSAYRNSRQ